MKTDRLLFSSDLDGTLLGDPVTTLRFKQTWEELPANLRPLLCYNSGRLIDDLLSLLSSKLLPQPDILIGGVGTQIYDFRSQKLLDEFYNYLCEGWDRAKVEEVLIKWPEAVKQPDRFLHPLKLSWYWDNASLNQQKKLSEQLEEAGLRVKLIYSSNRDLDILPYQADKGSALVWIAKRLQISIDHILVAGDTANDISMFQLQSARGIVVANAQSELRNQPHYTETFFSQKPYAEGILEGLKHFGLTFFLSASS